MFWQDPVGKSIDYLRLSRPFAYKICVISHNSRRYDAQILIRSFLQLRWLPKLIMDGTKIFSRLGNLYVLDSLNAMPMNLKSMLKSIDLTLKGVSSPIVFKHGQEFGLCGPNAETKYNGADFMSSDERAQISGMVRGAKRQIFPQ